jgi:sulfatase modifying factor 1
MRTSIATRKPSLGRCAGFAAMPVLAASLMLSCSKKDAAPQAAPPAEPAKGPPPARADAPYTTGYVVGCPVWMVRVNGWERDYCIDRFEAHITVDRGGKRVIHPPSATPKLERITAAVAPGVRPQSSIDRNQAWQACDNAGKRLCTMREWSRACRGAQSFTYPYGNEEKRGVCNTRKPHVLGTLFGDDARNWGQHMNDPINNAVPGFLARAGDYAGCVSSYGAYDMVGNLHEWVGDDLTREIIGSRPVIGKGTIPGLKAVPGNGIFMGGFYSTATENGEGCGFMTSVHRPDQKDYSVGFRCCKDAQ